MLTVDEARNRILGAISPLEEIERSLGDAVGLVLSRDILAPLPLPHFDNSAMDGYAVRSGDVEAASAETPVRLRLLGEVRAGDPGERLVEEGGAFRIMTGGRVPAGADSIVPVEEAEEDENGVSIRSPVARGSYLRRAGEDLKVGDRVVSGGTELGSGEVAVLAGLGIESVAVRRPPRVALLVTGDELVAPGAQAAPGQVHDSNSIALKTLALEAGAEIAFEAHVPDAWDEALNTFERASGTADVVVSSGGVSVGRYDLVKTVAEKLGTVDFWKVAMQPGKPVVFGSMLDKPFFGLPGNPVSVHVSFEQFVRPALRKMRGCRSLVRPRIKARFAERIEKRPGRLHFVRVRLRYSADGWVAVPTGAQGSHIQSSLVGCDGVAIFPVESQEIAAGQEVDVELWRMPEG